jgi:hypothetical protein
MAPSLPIAVFISPHGYGHAARACAVMQALSELEPVTRFEVFTLVPEWLFEDSLTCPFTYHPLLTDIGVVQKTPLVEDLEETIRRLGGFLPFQASLVDGLARTLETLRCRLVLCDISPLGLAVAQQAGLPSVLVENFTWDWIYEPYLASIFRFSHPIAALAGLFEAATAHIQTEPVCRPDARFPTVPPVSRVPRLPSNAVRRRLGVPADAPAVLLTMGGMPWRHGSLDPLEGHGEVFFVVPGAAERVERRGHLITLPHRSGFFHPDLVHASDAVVGKLGYSTVAEVYDAGVPFAYIQRPTFRESGPLAAFVNSHIPALPLHAADVTDGTWLARLPELLRHPKGVGPRASGAADAARIVHGLVADR